MRIAQNLIFIPVLVQILLTLVILGLLPIARGRSMVERRQRMQDMAIAGKTDWNEEAQKVAASFSNQFELPVLFYVLCLFALVTRMVEPVLFALAWLFVATRIVHAAIHIGPNVVKWRFVAYAAGLATLIAMAVVLTYGLIVTGF